MNNKIYDIETWVAIIIIPVVATFVGTVGLVINWQYTDDAVSVNAAIGTLFVAILGVSNTQYNKQNKE